MDRRETVEAFCSLQTQVAGEVFDWRYAADCFCGSNASIGDYSNEGQALAFIKEAVREKIERDKAVDEEIALKQAVREEVARLDKADPLI